MEVDILLHPLGRAVSKPYSTDSIATRSIRRPSALSQINSWRAAVSSKCAPSPRSSALRSDTQQPGADCQSVRIGSVAELVLGYFGRGKVDFPVRRSRLAWAHHRGREAEIAYLDRLTILIT